MLHIPGDIAAAYLETLETTRGTTLNSFQVRIGLPFVVPRLFEDDLSRLATVVGPLEVHPSEIIDVLRRAFGIRVVDEDVLHDAYPLEGPVVILAFGLDAREDGRKSRALAGCLGCLFPVVAIEHLLENCPRR